MNTVSNIIVVLQHPCGNWAFDISLTRIPILLILKELQNKFFHVESYQSSVLRGHVVKPPLFIYQDSTSMYDVSQTAELLHQPVADQASFLSSHLNKI